MPSVSAVEDIVIYKNIKKKMFPNFWLEMNDAIYLYICLNWNEVRH